MKSEELFKNLGAKYINTGAFHGVHWYSFIGNQSKIEEINYLNQYLIQEGKLVKDWVNIKKIGQRTNIVVFNPQKYNDIANNILQNVFNKYKDIPKVKKPIDIMGAKNKEIQLFVKYILEKKTKNKLDIFLYKTYGPREKTFIFNEGNNKYKKIIRGFYLTEEDFIKINEELSKYNKKIASLELRDLIDIELGIRYVIEITNADFIEKRV